MKKLIGSALFPGLGHLLAGRPFKGALLAVLFSITVQALFLAIVWPEAFRTCRTVLVGLAVGIWVYGLLSLWWLLRRLERARQAGQADQVMLAGIKAMLADDLKTAEEAFRTLLKLDDRDLEGWLYLARTCQLRGQDRRARKFYRVVRRLDRGRKWTWELGLLCPVARSGHADITS